MTPGVLRWADPVDQYWQPGQLYGDEFWDWVGLGGGRSQVRKKGLWRSQEEGWQDLRGAVVVCDADPYVRQVAYTWSMVPKWRTGKYVIKSLTRVPCTSCTSYLFARSCHSWNLRAARFWLGRSEIWPFIPSDTFGTWQGLRTYLNKSLRSRSRNHISFLAQIYRDQVSRIITKILFFPVCMIIYLKV